MANSRDTGATEMHRGWRSQPLRPTLSEVHRSLVLPQSAGFIRKLLAFAGPGFLVAVGYMDPGNWATDLAGGSKYNYTLLSVVMVSNLIAILLQSLSLKLGIATGRDLAQACRDHYSKPVALMLWVICELAIAACDLAEIIGSHQRPVSRLNGSGAIMLFTGTSYPAHDHGPLMIMAVRLSLNSMSAIS
jgi:manganese transport protein